MDWTNQDPELGRAIMQTEATLRRIEERLGSFDLLQQQLVVMERTLDAILSLTGKSFQGTLDPKAKDQAMKEAKELAEKLAHQEDEKMDAILMARGGDHPPTQAEIDAAEAGIF